MSLSSDERRSLARIEGMLRRSDPALAAMHDEFDRGHGGGRSDPQDAPVTASKVRLRVARLVAAAVLVILLVVAIVMAMQTSQTVELPTGRCGQVEIGLCQTRVAGREGHPRRPSRTRPARAGLPLLTGSGSQRAGG